MDSQENLENKDHISEVEMNAALLCVGDVLTTGDDDYVVTSVDSTSCLFTAKNISWAEADTDDLYEFNKLQLCWRVREAANWTQMRFLSDR